MEKAFIGDLNNPFPLAVLGDSKAQTTLLWFEGLRLDNQPLRGLARNGFHSFFKPLLPQTRVVLVGRPYEIREGSTFDDWLPLYSSLLEWIGEKNLFLAGMNFGSSMALSLAKAHQGPLKGLFLLGGGAALTPQGKAYYEHMAASALEHRYPEVLGQLARLMQPNPKGLLAFLSDRLARAFSQEIGMPDNPQPFVSSLWAEMAYQGDPKIQEITCPVVYFRGEKDWVYEPFTKELPSVEPVSFPKEGYGVFKTKGEVIRERIGKKLQEDL